MSKLTEQQIAELKSVHGEITELSVPFSDGENKCIYLKPLDRLTYVAVTKVASKDELQACEVLLKNLRVGGIEAAEFSKPENFNALLSASRALADFVTPMPAELKKN